MTQAASTLKSMGYDNPAYVTRQSVAGIIRAAAANGVTAKFVAHAALLAYSVTASVTAAGTSTYTFTGLNGSATIGINADQLSLIVVQNTGGTGSVALATTSYGPWVVTGAFNANGTYTNQIGQNQQFQINTNSGTAGLGGVLIPQGATYYLQGGTDATAAEILTLDYNIQPLGSVAA